MTGYNGGYFSGHSTHEDAESWAMPTGDQKFHFKLHELSAVLMNREHVPVGFIVSTALWKTLQARFHAEGNGTLQTPAHTFNGIKTAEDPSLPDDEFDVAFTEAAWTKRLREIGRT